MKKLMVCIVCIILVNVVAACSSNRRQRQVEELMSDIPALEKVLADNHGQFSAYVQLKERMHNRAQEKEEGAIVGIKYGYTHDTSSFQAGHDRSEGPVLLIDLFFDKNHTCVTLEETSFLSEEEKETIIALFEMLEPFGITSIYSDGQIALRAIYDTGLALRLCDARAFAKWAGESPIDEWLDFAQELEPGVYVYIMTAIRA